MDYQLIERLTKQLDFIQNRHALCTLKGALRIRFGELTIELNKARGTTK